MAKRDNSNTKKTGRKQTRLKTLRCVEDEVVKVASSPSTKNDRIKSAIEKGTQSILPSDITSGHYLTKFEHKGKQGPLVVYAEDKKLFNEFGHFTVITSFKPSDSLRNQLFFASPTASRNSAHSNSISSERTSQTTKRCGDRSLKDDIQETASVIRQKNSDRARQKHRHPNSFEGLVTRYKNRQDKYSRLLGDDALYLFKKIEHLCQSKCNENSAKRSTKNTVKERKPDSQVLPVLANSVDKTSAKPLNGSSNHSYLSKQKRKTKLPPI